jgi:glycosyltransferase involved in cell wall biosynthesis
MIPIYPTQFGKVHREGILKSRPKLLFLAYHFPPAKAAACVRTWNIPKYLARLGWDVTVVTPHPSILGNVEKTEEVDDILKRQGIKRILTGHGLRFLMPGHLKCWNEGIGWFTGGICRRIARYLDIDNGIGWIEAAERSCSDLTSKDVDMILATGSPFAAFELAERLSERFDCPYVLDYRDPWTGNPHAIRPPRPATIRKEARLLAGSVAVTIVSPSWALAMDDRFNIGPKLHVVTNGYDPEELTGVQPHDFGHFAIVYTGSFYPPKRVVSPVMAALKRLKETVDSKAPEWYFHYFGGGVNHVREEAQRSGVMGRVVLHGSVPRAEALSAVRGAGVAVVITSVTNSTTMEDNGIMTGKIFEALGLGTPILLVAPSGSDAKSIAETTELVQSFTGDEVEGMASFLKDMMLGRVLQPKDVDAYSWTSIARKLDTVLRKAVSCKHSVQQE